jgi:hypothetical protein
MARGGARLAIAIVFGACSRFEAVPNDAGPPPDSGSGQPDGGSATLAIPCGQDNCTASKRFCCDPDYLQRCEAVARDCQSTIVYECDDALDCAAIGYTGLICCGTLRDGVNGPTWPITRTYCSPSCNPDEIELCDIDAPATRACSKGTCVPDPRIMNGPYEFCDAAR